MLTSTVILAMYNGQKYIVEQLDSLMSQSHKPEKVIISDDGSSDQSVEIVERYIEEHNLVGTWICKQNEKNLGYANNFWYAAKDVETDIFFFCDQDDIWDNNKIETMLAVFEKYDHIQVLGSGYTPFTDGGEPYVDKALTKVTQTGELEKLELTNKTIFIGCEGCTMAVRTSLIGKIAAYHYDRAPHDEYVWKAALCINGCYVLHKSLMKRRFHENNVTHNKMHDKPTRIKFLELLLKSHLAMKQFAGDCNMKKSDLWLIDKNIECVELRINMLRKKRLLNIIPLAIKYKDCYHSKKAILMEVLIAMKKG